MLEASVHAHMWGMNATTRTHVQIIRTGSYSEFIVPHRCRNPRDVYFETATVIDIPVVDPAEAPVAFTFEAHGPEHHSAIRVFNEQLYQVMTTNHASKPKEPVAFGSEHFPELANPNQYQMYGSVRGLDTLLDYLDSRFGSTIVIDGYVWVPASEPRYVVRTFGMGFNHSGTALMTEEFDNSNIAANAYHRADDFTRAQKHAIEVAQERGDTESVGRIAKMEPSIHVHVPDAVRLVVPPAETREVRDLRRDLTSAVRDYEHKMSHPTTDSADEAGLFDHVVRLRRDLRKLTPDVAGVNRVIRPYEDR